MRKLFVTAAVVLVSVFVLAQESFARTLIVNTFGGAGKYTTIGAAHADATNSDVISVQYGQGTYRGAIITKGVKILAASPGINIDLPGSAVSGRSVGFHVIDVKGVRIQGFQFRNLDLPIYAEGTQGLIVNGNTLNYAVQAVTLWDCRGSNIVNNLINNLRSTNKGGGLGVFVGSSSVGISLNNKVQHNWVAGQVNGGGAAYWTAGIALYGEPASEENSGNKVLSNTVALSGPAQLAGVMLDQYAKLPNCVVENNQVKNNQLKNVAFKLVENPQGLSAACGNDVSGNVLQSKLLGGAVEVFPEPVSSGGTSLIRPF